MKSLRWGEAIAEGLAIAIALAAAFGVWREVRKLRDAARLSKPRRWDVPAHMPREFADRAASQLHVPRGSDRELARTPFIEGVKRRDP